MAYDNAVSALGKICQFHRDSIDSAQVLRMNSLPYIYRSDREILGPNNQFLPKIVSVFAEVLCGKDLATDKTLGRMANLLRHLQQTLPPATWASTLSVLHPQQQMTLQSILSS
ncbi:IMPORTIN BETA [Salix purpurea]|uniref:IMPORTIN BETA n=1 Tax=Salix purpurea TaxID=77065 RepID=A0A9Q0QDV5_SALPP|nr:IMPORTIN BETA [Salix purpurea]